MLCLFIVLNSFVFFIFFTLFTSCNGLYTINAPGTIQSNRKYTVCATMHDVAGSATLRIGLRSNASWSNIQMVTLQPYETKMLDFYPPKLDTRKVYELFAEGVKGVHFFNSEIIRVGYGNAANIFIEIDKGSYKPGDLLRFRVIILNEHAKPMKIFEPIKVQIFDASNARVKQFKDIRLKKGFYANEFQLSKDPVLGDWTIKVFIGGKYALEKQATFTVKKYVLPKFMVRIQTDEDFVMEDRYIKINVFGHYTYNKYVEGKVMLTINNIQIGNRTVLGNYTSEIVDFKAKFEIDISDFPTRNMLFVNALLMEKHTNTVQTAETRIYLHQQRYKITLLDDEIEFKNEIPYRIKVRVQQWNHRTINDSEASVFMQHGLKTYESKLANNGIATFEYDFQQDDGYHFWYKDSSLKTHGFISFLHRNNPNKNSSQCILKIQTKSPKPNSIIEIAVESEQDLSYLVYTLTSHANIIKNELVRLESKQNSYTIQIMPSNEMVPVSFLYVHYIIDGNLIYCETKINLPDELENSIEISSPTNVTPGEEITMQINTQPESHVAILAVDSSSIIFSPIYRIKKNTLLNMMRRDVTYASGGPQKTTASLSGLVTLTDAYFFKEKPPFSSGLKSIDIASEVSYMITEVDHQSVRSYFPETWICLDFEVTDAKTAIKFKLPDSITSWVITAFSLNEKTGIGIMNPSMIITASKTFFISSYLPYSIKRGEIVSIPIVLFNYYLESLKTEVVMANPLNEFKFVDAVTNKTTNSLMEKQDILVPANAGKNVNFLIYPQKLGDIQIQVRATNKLSTDGILQKLIVEPDGLTTSHNHELYVTLEPGENFTSYLKANMPPNVMAESEYLQLSISGNVLLPSFKNLDDLVDKATGCGEQNMIHFAPNVLVLEYLSATRQTSEYADLVAKAKKYTESGYQQQLKFRHSNGGYSVFGSGHSSKPSNWLTAYVVRFFIKALKYLPIEVEIIESSLDFLASEQLNNGEFKNAGYLFHPAYHSRYGFTAFVLLSFLENPKYAKKYRVVVEKAVDFLSSNTNKIDDIYSLAIMATVFQMAKHEHASVILNKLQPLAKTENGLQWWEDKTDDRVTDIEITSYILLALLHTPGQYISIAEWLLEQRNSNGGFKSTQDTVVGLQALIKFSQLTAPQNDTLIKVLYRALSIQNEEVESGVLGLDPENAKILQTLQLPASTRSIDIEITGTGSIFLQFSYQFRKSLLESRNFDKTEQVLPKSFRLKAEAELTHNSLTMNLELCILYQPLDDAKHSKTNMIIADIELPSGYVVNEEFIEEFKNGDFVDRIENDSPEKIILYFSYIEVNDEKCVNLMADKKDDVRNLKPSTIVVYEYYHSDRREIVTYEIENTEMT